MQLSATAAATLIAVQTSQDRSYRQERLKIMKVVQTPDSIAYLCRRRPIPTRCLRYMPYTVKMQDLHVGVLWLSTYNLCFTAQYYYVTPPHHNRFTAFFSGTTWVSRCQTRTSGLYGAREAVVKVRGNAVPGPLQLLTSVPMATQQC